MAIMAEAQQLEKVPACRESLKDCRVLGCMGLGFKGFGL